MTRFLMEAGPLIWPIILLTLVIGVLVLWNAISLLTRRESSMARRRQSIDAIIFWGGAAAVLGFLGQWMGINKLTQAVVERGVINPGAVVYGISESLLTPLAGMAVLVVAAFLWFFLRVGLWSVERRPHTEPSSAGALSESSTSSRIDAGRKAEPSKEEHTMSVSLDVSGLATAYRRLVLWFGVQLIWGAADLGLHPLVGEGLARRPLELVVLAGGIAAAVALVYYGYRTALALGSGVAWLWGIAMFVPLISIVTILVLSSKATQACRAQGVPVGLFGPKVPANG